MPRIQLYKVRRTLSQTAGGGYEWLRIANASDASMSWERYEIDGTALTLEEAITHRKWWRQHNTDERVIFHAVVPT